MNLTPTQLVLVRFLGPTDTLGSRIRLTVPQLGRSRTIPYNYVCDNAIEGAAAWLEAQDIVPAGRACVSKDMDALVIESCDLSRLFALFQRP